MNVLPHYLESYRGAYSHPGLEAAYEIQNIDVRTVRLLQDTQTVSEAISEAESNPFFDLHNTEQLDFNFGEELSPGISPLVLEEPIQVLMLSPSVEKILFAFDKLFLKDLMNINPQEWVLFKGIGQGHLDEIQEKLKEYLKPHVLTPARWIDFACLVRILVGACNRKQAFVLLDSYGLSDFISLSHAEKIEVRRMSEDEKSLMCQNLRMELKVSRASEKLQQVFGEIVQVLIKPWMRKREGLASTSELMERFERISKDPSITHSVLQFISDVFLDEQCVLSPYLEEVARKVYGVDTNTTMAYQKLIQKVLTYFYNPSTRYSLSELVAMLQQEFAKDWDGLPEIFIRKALSFSSFFYIYRNDLGQLMIQVS